MKRILRWLLQKNNPANNPSMHGPELGPEHKNMHKPTISNRIKQVLHDHFNFTRIWPYHRENKKGPKG